MVLKYTPLAAVLFSLQAFAGLTPAPGATMTTTSAVSATSPATASATVPALTTTTSVAVPALAVTDATATPVDSKSSTPSTAPVATPSPQASPVAVAPAQMSGTDNPVASSPALAPATVLVFTPEQEARIGEIAKAYLLEHPEVLLEVGQKLQVQQREQQIHAMTAEVIAHQDALLNDPSTPSYGPSDAKIALVEFFDYQCSVCAKQAPIIESLMKANPQVRYVFKEWPIFGARWPSSMNAAETGLQIWQQKGADVYLAYHNAVFSTGHTEGKLTAQDISHASAKAGKLKGNKLGMLDTLSQTDALAQNLGFQGTPGLIVMPVSGATADNVTVVPGGATQEMLQVAISNAGGQ